MRLFAIGDIHGCATALDTVLGVIAPRPGDRIITLGDYINKGPDSKAVLDRLVQLSRCGVLVPLLGNHELRFLIAKRLGKAMIHGDVLVDHHTLNSYAHSSAGQEDSRLDLSPIPDSHWQLLTDQGLRWFATDHHIFLHGTLSPQTSLLHQPDQAIFWDKLDHPAPHPSGKILICGHTPQRSGSPLNLGHTVCLDTAACEGQWLTCLEVHSGEIWQANQRGQLRRSHLTDYGPLSPTRPHRINPSLGPSQGRAAGPVPSWPAVAALAPVVR